MGKTKRRRINEVKKMTKNNDEEETMGKDEAMEIGRSLGWLKRKDPALYEYLIKRAEKEKIKASDLIVEAMKRMKMDDEIQLEEMTARQFLAMIRLWNEIMRDNLHFVTEMVRTFWIEGFTKYAEIISTIGEKVEAEMQTRKPKLSPDQIQAMIATLPETIKAMMEAAFTIGPQITQQITTSMQTLTPKPATQQIKPTEIKTEQTNKK
jgi:hypothetical protein